MATVESNSDELVSMVFSAPIHLCPVLYPNKKEGEEHEEHEHHEHHEHQERTELKEHHHHHHHCDLIVEEENAEEHHELHKDEELSPEPLPEHRSQSPLSNCTSVSEPSVYPEENQHHQELHENVHHEIHVSEEHFKEHKHHEVHETEEAQHGHDEPDVPQPDHEPHHEEHHHHQHEHEHEIEVHHAMHCQDSLDEVENAFKDIEEHFSRPAGGFMLEIEHHSILSDEDGGDSHMSYDLHERREVNEDIVPAKSEEHDRVIQELKAQQLQHSRVPSEVGGYKVSCWHNSDAQDEYEPAEFVEHHHEHHKDHESDEELPEAVPRTSLNHQQAVEHHYDTQSEHETEHEHEYENHKQHRDAVLAYDSERVGLIRHERTFSQRSEDLPVHEDAQREVSHAPGVRSLRNRFESGSLLNDDEVSVASRRSSLQTSVYEGRAREILQEVLGLSDDDTSQEVPDFSQHKRTSSVHSIDQTSLVSSRRSSTTFAPQKLAYTPPERGVTTPRSSNFNPEKFQSVRVVKSVRNQVLIWGGQELKPRHYSRRVSKVTNIGTVFEENQKVPQHLPSIEERRDSVFSSVSQPSRRTSNHVAAAESKRSSVSSVASRGTAAKSQASSRRTSVASTVTITDRKVAEKPVHQNFEYKPPVAKVEPASASSTMSYRHSATAKVPVSQRKSLFETEEIPSAKRNFIIVRKTTSTESNGNTSTTTAVKKTESNIGDWKKQVEAAF